MGRDSTVGSPADMSGGRLIGDSTVGSPADVLGGRPGGDSTVGSPADVLGRRRAWLGGGVRWGGGWGVHLVWQRLPLTGSTSDPRGRPGRVAAVTGLTRQILGGGGVAVGPAGPEKEPRKSDDPGQRSY